MTRSGLLRARGAEAIGCEQPLYLLVGEDLLCVGIRPGGGQPVAYLNSGSIVSPSLVPPGKSTFLLANFRLS
jgi:hypothetical protein